MTRRIPGQIDAAALARLAGHVSDEQYPQRADLHRPDHEGLRVLGRREDAASDG